MEPKAYAGQGSISEPDGRVEGGAEPLPGSGSALPPPPSHGGARAAAPIEPPLDDGEPLARPRVTAGGGRPRVARTEKAEAAGPRKALKPEQRLPPLDTWKRSGLAATEFAAAIARVVPGAHRRGAIAVDIEAGGVDEDQIDALAEQVAITEEQIALEILADVERNPAVR